MLGNYIKKLGKEYEKLIEQEVLRNLRKYSPVKTYLDLGADDGKKTLERARVLKCKNTVGVEVESSRAKKARKAGVKIVTSDLNKKWAVKTSSVDVITATEVIEHMVDVDNFLGEARRVLKKGGKLIISTENLAAYHNIFALIIGNQPYTGPYLSRKYPIGHRPNAKYYQNNMNMTMYPHLNVMTFKALKQLFEAYGFKIRSEKGVGVYPLSAGIANVMSQIDRYHSSYIVIVGEK